MYKRATYNPPITKMAVRKDFCTLSIGSFQMRGTGKPTSTTSVMICGIEVPTKSSRELIEHPKCPG